VKTMSTAVELRQRLVPIIFICSATNLSKSSYEPPQVIVTRFTNRHERLLHHVSGIPLRLLSIAATLELTDVVNWCLLISPGIGNGQVIAPVKRVTH
jgi:hypothetical protein